MKRISAWISVLIIAMVLMVPMNSMAVISDEETMATDADPLSVNCSDDVEGITDFGDDYDPEGDNFVDLTATWEANDDLTINMNVVASSDGLYKTRHNFWLEVYNLTNWTAQGNPVYRDSWEHIINSGGGGGQQGHQLQVSIPDADEYTNRWIAHYTCEITNVDQFGPPPWSDTEYNNYWILLIDD